MDSHGRGHVAEAEGGRFFGANFSIVPLLRIS